MRDLIRLYSFESVHSSEDETNIADWICKWLDHHKIKYKRLDNNIYNLSYPDTPILSAHLDQVGTNGKGYKYILTKDNYIKAYNKDYERTSLGADDKNGVWLILKLLEEGHTFNFIISEGEEVGRIGINKINLSGINYKTQYCIVLDRRGDSEILNKGSAGKYCSTLAQDLCNFLGERYEVASGLVSDTDTICKYCECVNMSVGYYFPHTQEEYTDFEVLKEIKEDLSNILNNFIHYPTNPKEYKNENIYKRYYNF